MKNPGMLIYVALFAGVIIASVALGGYDPITPAVPEAKAALLVGPQAAGWIGGGLNWLVGLVIGGVCTGFGVAAFREIYKAYSLWKRDATAGRWQSGPNANWQRPQAQGAKLSRQDMLLLALSGRLPGGVDPSGKAPFYSTTSSPDEDELNIQL